MHYSATMLKALPLALIVLRFSLGPVMLLVYIFSLGPVSYGVILTLGFLSDFADGILARRLGVATDRIRSLDSWADTVFYLCVFLVAMAEHFELLWRYIWWIGLILILELLRHVYEQHKFGKSASYHMWSAKLWGLFLYLGFMQLLMFGEAGWFFVMAIVLGIACDIEGFMASLLLKTWRADVPSIWHAYRISKLQ